MEIEPIFRDNTKLYVYLGGKHADCDNENLIKVKHRFFQGKTDFVQEVGFCPKCKKLFILDLSKENVKRFCDYKLFDEETNEKIPALIRTNWKDGSTYREFRTQWKSHGGTIDHPYQGGACSGK